MITDRLKLIPSHLISSTTGVATAVFCRAAVPGFMAVLGSMAVPGIKTVPGTMAVPDTMAVPGTMAVLGSMAVPGTMTPCSTAVSIVLLPCVALFSLMWIT